MNLKKSVLLATLLGCASVAGANEVVISSNQTKSGSIYSFDVALSGEVAGFQFMIEDPRMTESGVDVSKCTADLPKGLSGYCRAAEGKLGVIVFSPDASKIPGDMVAVGSIRVTGMAKAGGELKVSSVEFSDRAGKAMNASVKIDGGPSSREGNTRQLQK